MSEPKREKETNLKRAKKIFETWPQWKKDFELTKYSIKSKTTQALTSLALAKPTMKMFVIALEGSEMFDDFEIKKNGDRSYTAFFEREDGSCKETTVMPGASLEWFLLDRIYRHKSGEQ